MKRKRTQGLLTVSNKDLTTGEKWADLATKNCNRMQKLDEGFEPSRDWIQVSNLAEDEAEILVYGEITPYPWDAVDKSGFDLKQELSQITASTIHLRINSPGGSIFEAVTMFNLLRQHPSNVIAHIDGLAASCAGWLVMAADEIVMGEATRLMIHEASAFTGGTKSDFRDMADIMEGLEGSILKVFNKRTGLSIEELTEMMEKETYLNEDEALEKGFIDRIEAMPERKKEPSNKSPKLENKSSDGEEPDEKTERLKVLKMRLELNEKLTNQTV